MKECNGRFTVADGMKLFFRCWQPADPKAALIIVHGIGEHGQRYQNIIDILYPQAYSIYIFDLRGHGQSPGHRGHIDSWNQYRTDLAAFVDLVKNDAGQVPLFLFGHSMGSLIVLDFIINHPDSFSGLIVSGAALEPRGVSNPLKILMARFLSNIWPRYSLPLGIDVSALSDDQNVLDAYRKDPLVHGKGSVRWGMESLRIIKEIKNNLAKIYLPILIMHGARDRINITAGSELIYKEVGSEDKTLFVHPDSHHELHNDIRHMTTIQVLRTWLQRRLDNP